MGVARVALTGGIASGKSTVAGLWAGLGARIVDYDQLARQAVEPGTPGLEAVEAAFGPGVLLPDGSLDRVALGELVFADDGARRRLEAIVHPEVWRLGLDADRRAAEGVVVHMVPLLAEALSQRPRRPKPSPDWPPREVSDFDAVVVVDVSPEVQLERLMARSGLSEAQARARIDSQAGRGQRLRLADFVIANDGSFEALAQRARAVYGNLFEISAG
ncbi:MAG: dephospho-CoA kinase [Propionibacteriaceae bacterium]|jgi:dephospho-CoA kinase|nr:dephospho-CoA kinase [Propionibacteriaceae bacterium]